MRDCLAFILSIVLFVNARAQDFSYTAYNTKDGLAGSVVYCAAEDKDGFLWFGTEVGLSRFDGTHFRNFSTVDGLSDNEIIKLFVDSRNRVWIAPFKNSICYYQKGQLHTQENDPVLHRLSIAAGINGITEDKYGNIILTEPDEIIIIGPDQEIRTITQAGGCPTLMPIGGGLNRDRLFTFFSRSTSSEIRQYSIDKNVISYTGKRSYVGQSVNDALLSPGLDVFDGDDSLHFIPSSGRSIVLPLPHDFISISKIDDSLVTLNTSKGAFMYNLRTGKQAACFLTGQSVNSVIRDSEGSMWFMCAGGGICRIGSFGFRNLVFSKGNNRSVTDIQKIGDSLFIGTGQSLLWRSDLALRSIHRQRIDWGNNMRRILSVIPLPKNGLLLGTDEGLIRQDHSGRARLLQYTSMKSITSLTDGVLISTSQNVEIRLFPTLEIARSIWSGRSTCSFLQDSTFYIGTLNGLFSLSPDKKKTFWGERYPILRNRIAAISAAPDGTLWVGTSGSGIAAMKEGRLVCQITEKNGLTSNICRNIFISGDDIWVGTDKGLNRVHMEAMGFRITTLGVADGLSSDIINTVYSDNDEVYVGSANGLTHFKIQEATQRSICRLRITSIRAASMTWGYDTSGFVLSHRESSIRLDFAGISYRSMGSISYRYRLRGLDDNWQTTKETSLSYPTLPSGSYELQIVATNKFGIESDPVKVNFTVEKLLWEKTWFLFLTGGLLIGVIWILLWLRIRHLKRKNAERIGANNRIAELEQQTLRAQMNPHFIFNSLNSIQKYVMEKDIKGANKFITNFSRLIRLTLDITSRARLSIDEEIMYISHYIELERARFGNTFEYEVTVAQGIDRHSCHIPPMILQPYVENSIRHGLRYRGDDMGVIVIRFEQMEAFLICIVEDNGIGRRLAQQYKSMSPIEYQSKGMSLTERRLEMMNQGRAAPIRIAVEDLETADRRPTGTRITLYFPMQYVSP